MTMIPDEGLPKRSATAKVRSTYTQVQTDTLTHGIK